MVEEGWFRSHPYDPVVFLVSGRSSHVSVDVETIFPRETPLNRHLVPMCRIVINTEVEIDPKEIRRCIKRGEDLVESLNGRMEKAAEVAHLYQDARRDYERTKEKRDEILEEISRLERWR